MPILELIQEKTAIAKRQVQDRDALLKQQAQRAWRETFLFELGQWIDEWSFSDKPVATLRFEVDKDVVVASINRFLMAKPWKSLPVPTYSLCVRGPIKRLLLVEDVPIEKLTETLVSDAIALAVTGQESLAKAVFKDKDHE